MNKYSLNVDKDKAAEFTRQAKQSNLKEISMGAIFGNWKTTLAGLIPVVATYVLPLFGVSTEICSALSVLAIGLLGTIAHDAPAKA